MKKQKLFKRALAAILTLTMALGILPVTAFAEEETEYLEGSSFITQNVLDEGIVLTDKDDIEAYLQETGTEMYSIQVGSNTIEVPKADYENGSVFAMIEDEIGQQQTVNVSSKAARTVIPVTARVIGAITISVVRTTSTTAAMRVLIINEFDAIQTVEVGKTDNQYGNRALRCGNYSNQNIIYQERTGRIYTDQFGGYTGSQLLIQLPSFSLSPNTGVFYCGTVNVQGAYASGYIDYDSRDAGGAIYV